MSADVISLRQARKVKARAEKEARAERNRIMHGRTKAERRHADAIKHLQEKRLDSMMMHEPIEAPDDEGQTAD
jgi:hypothetical protein